MAAHKPVPHDTADEIRELRAAGYGRNKIGQITGTHASTVRNVLDGKAVEFCNDLTTRQISGMLAGAFSPLRGR
jgi:hypothetical protein